MCFVFSFWKHLRSLFPGCCRSPHSGPVCVLWEGCGRGWRSQHPRVVDEVCSLGATGSDQGRVLGCDPGAEDRSKGHKRSVLAKWEQSRMEEGGEAAWGLEQAGSGRMDFCFTRTPPCRPQLQVHVLAALELSTGTP